MGGPSQLLLLFNALIVAIVTVYKFTSKQIAPLFILQTLSHYSFFLAFTVLIKYSENSKIQEIGGKILKRLMPLHFLYIFIIIFGYLKISDCSEENPYPLSFVLGDSLFFLSFIAAMSL